MKRDSLEDIEISNSDDFRTLLSIVLEKAVREGIDVRGAWAFETGGSTHNWEVEIIELANGRSERVDRDGERK